MKLKKGDIIVIIVAVCLFVFSVSLCFLLKKSGKQVRVYENNKLIFEGSLFSDTEIKLSHNLVAIKNGKVYMKKSDCKNQICVKTGMIENSRECIVCLPNKVIIEVE
ncbi:MAG: NusG domain II-containing protein [Clostridia bacterium]|nr:NusG domain II-containing protein [Clostridia bacterium]